MRKAVWGWVVAVVVITGALLAMSRVDWQDQGPRTDATGNFSQQREGASQAGKREPVAGQSQDQRFDQVTGSLRPVQLSDEQRRRLRDQIANQRHAHVDTFGASISIGASVPRQIALHDLPVEIADNLGGYHGSKFVVVRDQMVIVDEARRIVAIIPDVA